MAISIHEFPKKKMLVAAAETLPGTDWDKQWSNDGTCVKCTYRWDTGGDLMIIILKVIGVPCPLL